MSDDHEVTVLRLGHRPGRDERMTTHVGLTARALGADRVVMAGSARDRTDTIVDITERFGGPFEVDVTQEPKRLIRDFEGTVVHLTMYGEPVQDVEDDVREAHAEGPLLLVVGAEKVPFEVYENADYNVGVTNQPHSEVASLAVFLDRLFEGRELDREWDDPDRVVVPMETGKRVVDPDEAEADE
ncbi:MULTISPECIES: tRNA (cytidine(56)-2'-O)-methyltransferase [Haloarcula]|uniref:tRNA (cytidine(56)-2'-O)-methyltransferase n=1 Tax=Haloarcula pellucida TaxID=1427151 RepID=A0A830GKX2_9EURY|nr:MULTISPECIES: tRNA (cytidine(56)-2'-O)-methyltransferase [Halomicroarcula]MBX0347581.1 tRNA (cytidine(56)-2'-O)-methyltransferase [Halomicroarcula pellucida]MDS0276497.1 tRNA (cytidine(56)-2'-O)-methyltransferase [Halomicroarcula sp. S1AR25-4]GGN89396.1 tRNA (cytidine(56)-2'-O)-methyltransferase [Halomicroarcula pellucida]